MKGFFTLLSSIELLKKYLETQSCGSIRSFGSVTLAPIEKEGQTEEDLLITLLRIEEETSRKPQSVHRHEGEGVRKQTNPDVCLNLYILISSHARQYETALAQISDAIYWMNGWRPEEHGGIVVELQSLTAEQHNSLWQTLGGIMVPSVVYKVRMVTISSETVEEDTMLIEDKDVRIAKL